MARFDRGFDVGAAAGDGGAEFVEDQAEALRVGQRVDVVDQVGVDAGAVVFERQQVLAGAGLARLDHFQRRRRLRAGRARQGRPAVDVLLADQRLRADDAVGVLAEVLEAGVFDLHHDHRLAGDRFGVAVFEAVDFARQRDADRFDFADVGAGDPHLLALDHERAVVEDRADDVAFAAAAAEEISTIATTIATTTTAAISPLRLFMARAAASEGLHWDELTPEPENGGSTKGLEPSGAGLGGAARAASFGRPPRRRRR